VPVSKNFRLIRCLPIAFALTSQTGNLLGKY